MDNEIDNSLNFFLIFRNKYLKNKIMFDLTLFNNHRKVRSFSKDAAFKKHRYYNYLLNIEINFVININNFKDVIWPPFLEVLKFSDKIIKLDNDILMNIANQCKFLKCLYFDSLRHHFIPGTLSSSIEELCLGKYTCNNLPVAALYPLNKLKKIYMGSIYDKPIFDYNLPVSLTSLSFGCNSTYNNLNDIYSYSLDVNNYSAFNQPIDFVAKLPNLTYLNTGTKFNQIITPNTLNNGSLSTLILGQSFHNSIGKDILPDTLTSLSIFNENYGRFFKDSVIPNSVKSIFFISLIYNSNLITPNIKTIGLIHYDISTKFPPNSSINTIITNSLSSDFQLKLLPESITEFSTTPFCFNNTIINDIDYNNERFKYIKFKIK